MIFSEITKSSTALKGLWSQRSKRKLTASVLAFLLILQTVIGVFSPINISITPPYISPQETQAAGSWTVGSGGDAWSGNVTLEDLTEDKSDSYIKIGMFWDSFNQADTSDVIYGWGGDTASWKILDNTLARAGSNAYDTELYALGIDTTNYTILVDLTDDTVFYDIAFYMQDTYTNYYAIWPQDDGNRKLYYKKYSGGTTIESFVIGNGQWSVGETIIIRVGDAMTSQRVKVWDGDGSNWTFSTIDNTYIGGSAGFGHQNYYVNHKRDNFRIIKHDNGVERLSGTLTSISKDAEDIAVGDIWKQISFTGTVSSPTTTVNLEVDSSDDNITWDGWATVQTDAVSGTTYYIPEVNQKRYGKFRLTLNTTDISQTPEIQAVVLTSEAANTSPASPASPTQLKNDETTVISNQGHTEENNVKLKASATDEDNPEIITLFFETALSSGSFNSPAIPITGTSCASGTEWSSCPSKIWYVTSSNGDYTVTPYAGITNVAGLSDATTYKWQVKACDDDSACSSWVAYNATVPNFTLDTTSPDIVAIDAGASSADRISLTSDAWFKYSDTGSDDQLSFSWTDPVSTSDDTFYYELNSISTSTITGDESTTTNPYIDDITVTEGTNYFHARPRNGASVWGTERTFVVKYDKTNPTVSISSPASDTSTSNNQPTLTWSGSDATSGIAKYQLYIDSVLDTDNISATSVTTTNELTCGSHTWYIRAYDNVDNYTDSSSFNLTMACGGGLPPSASNLPAQPEPTSENPEGGFGITILRQAQDDNNIIVTLKLYAGADTVRMAISNTKDFKNASQILYEEEIEWDLLNCNTPRPLRVHPSQEGNIYTVYAKFYTQYGVASEVVSDSIVLKTITTENQLENPNQDKPKDSESLKDSESDEDTTTENNQPISFIFTQTLQFGSNNEEVKTLQDKLKELNFFPEEIESNGNFGPTTEQAIKEYQASKGIYPCGIVGPRTRKALNNEEFITNKDYQFTQDLKYNDRNEEVQELQTRLRDQNFFPYNIESTGWFGSITQKAVNLFQKFYNLIPSGIVDEGMREVLNR